MVSRSFRSSWRALRPFTRRALIGLPCVAAALSISVHTAQRVSRARAELREFEVNSASAQLMEALDTGDVVVFERAVDARLPRALLVALQKFAAGRFDHCGVIVRAEGDVPRVLECGWFGCALRPFDARVLHAHTHQILVRKIEGPKTVVGRLEAERFAAAVATEFEHGPNWPLRLLLRFGWLVYHCARSGSGGGTRSQFMGEFGALVVAQQEIARIDARLAEIDVADTRVERLRAARTRAVQRLQKAAKFLHEHERCKKAGDASSGSDTDSSSDIARRIERAANPSAALVAEFLIALGVLESMATVNDSGHSQTVRVDWSHALPKHFLSLSTLPLAPGYDWTREFFVKSDRQLSYTIIG